MPSTAVCSSIRCKNSFRNTWMPSTSSPVALDQVRALAIRSKKAGGIYPSFLIPPFFFSPPPFCLLYRSIMPSQICIAKYFGSKCIQSTFFLHFLSLTNTLQVIEVVAQVIVGVAPEDHRMGQRMDHRMGNKDRPSLHNPFNSLRLPYHPCILADLTLVIH